MELKIADSENTATVSEKAFGQAFNEALIHQVVTAYLASAHQGTKKQKTRSEVRGGGTKPWRQKGTGRARAGTLRSPIWRGGGVTFAARPRNYAQKINKKMYRAALRSIVSELLRQDRLLIVESFSIEVPKTRELLKKLEALTLRNVLIVVDKIEQNLFLAGRNLPAVEVTNVAGLNPVSLLKFEKVMITVDAVKQIEEWLA